MPPKKKSKCNISGICNQKTAIPVIDDSHEDAIPSGTPPGLNIEDQNDELDEEWIPNSENEEDFLNKTEEERPGVNPRKYQNKGLYVSLMRMAIDVGDDPMNEDWVPKKTKKKFWKEKKNHGPKKMDKRA
ncbi:hypothetical protein BYT27DRAFT_7207575 [Phlegmacium glaucopus]|nr:hypothetical protein BYT27DRAFT_7207575 [Phlegmacium glaucopus]